MRPRILQSAAVLALTCLGGAAPTAAQLIGTCPMLTPPPCIITDPGRIAGTVAELKQKKQELDEAIKQVREYTSVNNALGKLGPLSPGIIQAIRPANPQTFRPLSEVTNHIAGSAAAKSLDAVLSSYPDTVEGNTRAKKAKALRIRAAGGEAYALAAATKTKLDEMSREAARLTDQMKKVAASPAGADLRTDWAVNQQARKLMLESMLTLREVQTARLHLASIQNLPARVDTPSPVARAEAAPLRPFVSPGYAEAIGNVSEASNRLAALLQAREVFDSFHMSIKGAQDTQAEYQQIKNAATQAQKSVAQLAYRDAYRKGTSAQSLLRIADQYMQTYDRTTWDNPGKQKAAESAARYAEKALDGRVKGDVNNDWSKYLGRRAEAYKQEAFFRPIAADAQKTEQETRKALAEYEQALGIKASDPAALNAAIRKAEADMNSAQQRVASMPPHIVRKTKAIVDSYGLQALRQTAPVRSGAAQNTVATTDPLGRNPTLAEQRAGYHKF